MPRKPRQISQTGTYHFINRGVNKKPLFHKPADYEHYLELLREYSKNLNVEIHHYCLMINHTHLLVGVEDMASLSKFGHFVQRRYAYYYCKIYHWSEQVFRKRFISLPIENEVHFLECARYIERNPLDAKIVEDLKAYLYSSYGFYAYDKPNTLITESSSYLGLSANTNERMMMYRFYVEQNRAQEKEMATPF